VVIVNVVYCILVREHGSCMTVCEYQFESFNAYGAGWKLIESRRDSNCKGWWQVELFKAGAGELAVTGGC